MKILVAASEMVPFVKTGGLGDVVGALPEAMARAGHEVRVFVPRYASMNPVGYQVRHLDLVEPVAIGESRFPAGLTLARRRKSAMEVYLVENARFFDRDSLYVDGSTGQDWPDNDERYHFFCRAVLQFCRRLEFRPDIVHVHDWQTGLIPVLLKVAEKDGFFAGARSVLTIHNLAHQGSFAAERYDDLGLPKELFYAAAPFEFWGKVNFLKAAIVHADKITTVSPRYAEEIQTPEFGAGLDGVLRERFTDVVGILNGVDYTVWSPSRDRRISYRYHPANLSGKRACKVDLMNAMGLPLREGTPLIGIVSRLAHQKGFDLIVEAADRLLARNLQMVVLGIGDSKYEDRLKELEKKFFDRLRVYLELDEDKAHRIEAGADMFLMPSLFEPCGLNQLYSLKYGTVPIVHEVGGLADTIEDYDSSARRGTGFVFREATAEALLATVDRALAVFGRKRSWTQLMKAGMKQDFSWDKSVDRYLQFFERMLSR